MDVFAITYIISILVHSLVFKWFLRPALSNIVETTTHGYWALALWQSKLRPKCKMHTESQILSMKKKECTKSISFTLSTCWNNLLNTTD